MIKKFLSILLAVMMMFSIVPVTNIQASAASSMGDAETLSLNSFNNAVITNEGESAFYSYVPSKDGMHVIYSTSDADTSVSLYGPSANLLASDDDSGDSYNFRLQYSMKAEETYFIEVKYSEGSAVTTGTIPFTFGEMYNITYKSDKGENLPSSQTKDFGTDVRLSNVEPTRDNFVFLGWSTSPDSLTAEYMPDSIFSVDKNTNLYAVWGLDINSNVFNSTELTLNSSAEAVISHAEGREYFKFTAPTSGIYGIWSTTNVNISLEVYDSAGIKFKDGSFSGNPNFQVLFEIAAGQTIYFEVGYTDDSRIGTIPFVLGETYKITYVVNGGTISPESQMKIYNQPVTFATPTRIGYMFKGWATSADSTDVAYEVGDYYTANANVTLYALWEKADVLDLNSNNNAKITTAGTSKYFSYTPTEDGMYVIYSNSAVDTEVVLYNSSGIKVAENDNMADTDELHYYGEYEEIRDKRFANDFRLPYYMFADETYYFEVSFKEVTRVGTIPFTFGEAYTVSYDTTGGTTAPSPQIKDYGATLVLNETVPTRVGYAFKGWATSENGAVEYSAGEGYAANESVTLYAVWEQGSDLTVNSTNNAEVTVAGESKYFTFTPTESGEYVIYSTTDEDTCISLYYSDGELVDSSDDSGEGFNMKLRCDMVAREKYYFEIKYYDETKTGTIPFTFGKVYTVSYKVEGADGAFATQDKEYGIDLTLDCGTLPTKEGYTLKGWSTSATDSTVAYALGDTYTNEANVTLYAVWELNTYDVTYDANGGENAPAGQVKTHGTDLTLSTDEPTREGYTFKGWSTTANGAVEYAPGDVYTSEEEIVLYAVWEINTYDVTYDVNGGENAPEGQSGTYGSTLTLSSAKPTRTGYTFKGWATDVNATTVVYSAGDSFVIDADVVLYAVWEINTYTVSYNANGGEGAPAGQVKTYGVDLTLSTDEPTREGYTFLGWATSSNATSATYVAGDEYTVNVNTVLYAVWGTNTYTVSYDANGGENAPASQTKTYGTTLTLSRAIPTRTGYAFLGWATSPDATSATYFASASFDVDADTTLYAIWEADVELTVNSNNNAVISVAGQSKYFTFTPTESGAYVIYSTSEADTRVYLYNNSGKQLENDDDEGEGKNFRMQYNLTAGTTYRFEIKYNSISETGTIPFTFGEVYKVTYDANGGTGDVYLQYKDYGTDLTLRNATPTRKGYAFLGWSTSSTATSATYYAADNFTLDADTTLYAVWSKNGLKKIDNKWYYVNNGKIDTSKTGLVKHTNGIWYYVEDGELDWSKTGLVKHTNGKWYYVEDGRLDWSKTGLCKHGKGWYYVKKGVVDFTYTGLCKRGTKWYYVDDGKVNFKYTGLCKYSGKWYYVEDGAVDKSFTGYVTYNGKKYKVVKGVKV